MGQDPRKELGERFETSSISNKESAPCQVENCKQPAVAIWELGGFCLSHFISYSYQKLEQWSVFSRSDPPGTTRESTDRFLQECFRKSAHLLDSIENADNLTRAKLFDILLWASEVSARRSALGQNGNAALYRFPSQSDKQSRLADSSDPRVRETLRLG